MILMAVYIIFSGPIFMGNLPFLLVQLFGLLIIIWAVLARRMHKPGKHTPFTTYGPYEIIRHPIYAGFLLVMCAFVQGYASISRFFAFFILLICVLLKIIYDERKLEKESVDYKHYQKKTHRIIPYLW